MNVFRTISCLKRPRTVHFYTIAFTRHLLIGLVRGSFVSEPYLSQNYLLCCWVVHSIMFNGLIGMTQRNRRRRRSMRRYTRRVSAYVSFSKSLYCICHFFYPELVGEVYRKYRMTLIALNYAMVAGNSCESGRKSHDTCLLCSAHISRVNSKTAEQSRLGGRGNEEQIAERRCQSRQSGSRYQGRTKDIDKAKRWSVRCCCAAPKKFSHRNLPFMFYKTRST